MNGQMRRTFMLGLSVIASLGGGTVLAAPRPACTAIAPVDGATLISPDPVALKLKLEWRPMDGVKTYLLEVGKTPDLTPGTRSLSAEIPMTHYTVGGLRPGHYYWRVSPLGKKTGSLCEFTIAGATFPNVPSVLGAVASGRPLVRSGGPYCDAGTAGKGPRPFGTFFIQTLTDRTEENTSNDVLSVCVGDKISGTFAHRFPNDLGLNRLTSKTIHAGLLLLPNGAGLEIAIVPTSDGPVLGCLSRSGYEGVPATKPCTGADVTVSVRDAAKAIVEVTLPDGRKEQHTLAELLLP